MNETRRIYIVLMAAERKVTDFVTTKSNINVKATVLCESSVISIPNNIT